MDEGAPAGVTIINERCVLRTQDGHRVVLVCGIVLAQYAVGDAMAEANAMVSLVDQGWADQVEVSRAFECTTRTVRRYVRRFEEGGLAALGRSAGYPRGRPRVGSSRSQLVCRLKGTGHSNREIARRIGVSEVAVRKLLRRLGWTPSRPVPGLLSIDVPGANPNLSAFAASTASMAATGSSGANPNLSASTLTVEEEIAFTLDTDPADRSSDRLLACLGLIDDAAPLARAGVRVPRAGVLLALPAIQSTAASSTSSGTSTAALVRPSTGYARPSSPCC